MVGEKFKKINSFILTFVLVITIFTPIYHSWNVPNDVNLAPPGWTEDIRLTTNASAGDYYPSIDAYEDKVHIVWRNQRIGQNEIYYINSIDGGATWCQGTRLSPGHPIDCTNPDIEVNKGQINIVWDEHGIAGTEITYRCSPDEGISWNGAEMISTNDGFDSVAPKIAIYESNIHVVWVDARFGLLQPEIYYKRSTDGGASWNDGLGNTNLDRRLSFSLSGTAVPHIATNGTNIHVVFEDIRDGNINVYYVRSTDNGITWDDGLGSVGVERKLTLNSTDHGQPIIAVDGDVIHAVWTDRIWPGPVEYLYYMNSTDNGVTWNQPRLISGPSPIINSPDIAVEDGKIHLTWGDERDDGLHLQNYYMMSPNGGVSWNDVVLLTNNLTGNRYWPRLAVEDSTVHITWWDDRDGQPEIYYKRFSNLLTATVNLTLSLGWNLISLPTLQPKLNGTAITCADDLTTATGCTMLSKWNASSQDYINFVAGFNLPTDPENFPIGDNDAVFLWWNESYNITFNIAGYEPGPQNVHLFPGWNMIAYNRLTVGDVEVDWADQTSCDIYNDICYYDDGTFKHYIFPGTEMKLVPTRGYFVWSDYETWLSY